MRDQFGQLMGSKKDRQGQVIITQVKGDFLRTLAETARGSFNYAMYDGSHLKELARQISEFEKTQFSQDLAVDYDEKYIWPLSLGFALLFLSLCVSDRRRSNQVWKGRYEI